LTAEVSITKSAQKHKYNTKAVQIHKNTKKRNKEIWLEKAIQMKYWGKNPKP
jgi:hypothetical protein